MVDGRTHSPARRASLGWLVAALPVVAIAACGGGGDSTGDTADLPPAGESEAYFALCGGEVKDLGDVVKPIAEDLTAQKIPYARGRAVSPELRDCSGNFLRLSSRVAEVCPEAAASLAAPAGVTRYQPGGDNVFPHYDRIKGRASQGIGRWYHRKGRFRPVYYDGATGISVPPPALEEIRDLVRPGAVLWFSRTRPMEAGGTDPLWGGGGGGGKGKINHMGTVTAVERDAAGNVIRYSMYHGHGKDGTPADITDLHFWEWPDTYTKGGSKEYPPFGYWDQYLVGIATLVPTIDSG